MPVSATSSSVRRHVPAALASSALLALMSAHAGSHQHSHDDHAPHAADRHAHEHDNEGERRQSAAHVHGLSTLNLVMEGSLLALELSGPAVNFIGFEHAPRTEQQHATLATALARLESPESLFSLPAAAGCVLRQTDVHAADFSAAATASHSEHQHDHQHGHAHDHEHDHEHAESSHADLGASWEFECANPAGLRNIEVQLFSSFPLTEELQANLITPALQTRQLLGPGRTTLRLVQ